MRIFAHDFARKWCDDREHDYCAADSSKDRGACPSCDTRRRAGTAAHLCNHVFPSLDVHQYVLSVPKRLRHFLQRGGVAAKTERPLLA